MKKRNVLIAPLNWGLGHATRCIPIIQELLKHGFDPIIASDGNALELLKKEFPEILCLELPSYQIEYAKQGHNLKWKLIENSPKMLKAIFDEKKLLDEWIVKYDLKGIISDNRFGIRSSKIPSVFVTHQLNVLSGSTTLITSKIHQFVVKMFDECWVPDVDYTENLSGYLGHLETQNDKVKYIGPLSRFQKVNLPIEIDLLAVLSGPEPQRSLLEEKLLAELQNYNGNVVLVKGIVQEEQEISQVGKIKVYNYMTSAELERAMNSSELIVARSGYSTIMDLSQLEKKVFLIPTPGQFEQEYLAKKLQEEGRAPFANQADFSCDLLKFHSAYETLDCISYEVNWFEKFKIFRA